MESFLKTSDDVASNLKDRYKDQWVDPKDDRASQKEQASADQAYWNAWI